MNKKIKTFLISFLFITILFYLTNSFIVASFDFTTWNESNRAGLVMAVYIATAVFNVYYLIHKNLEE